MIFATGTTTAMPVLIFVICHDEVVNEKGCRRRLQQRVTVLEGIPPGEAVAEPPIAGGGQAVDQRANILFLCVGFCNPNQRPHVVFDAESSVP